MRGDRATTAGGGGAGRGGFTLVELLMVIGIIIVLVAASVPALNAFRRGQRLDHASRLVQSALNDVRRRAVTTHARHVVVLYGFEDPTAPDRGVRHALAVYSEPVGRPHMEGYFEGGYVGRPLVLPDGVRFSQELMQLRIWQAEGSTPGEPLPLDSPYFRRRNSEALAYLPDGTLADFQTVPATDVEAGRNIYLEEEGYYQVREDTRADIIIVEVAPDGSELRSGGRRRRALINLTPSTGRSIARVFDVGDSYERLAP